MVEESDALARILAAADVLDAVETPLLESVGRFLAQPIRARLAHPRFHNSTVDGYALRVVDGPGERQIVGEQPAGKDRGYRLNQGEAIRIFTGAPVPEGCSGIAMQEDVSVKENKLTLLENVNSGENIRRAGADMAAGQLIASAGERMTPQLAALLASQGLATVSVHRPPRVTILSTGDELRPAGAELVSGEIYDANSTTLAALMRPLGIAARCRISPDDPHRIEAEIRDALAKSEVLLISGGVSVGAHDYVRPALASLGVEPNFWQIRMKPGKPLAFARAGKTLVVALPGNAVATFVCFLVLIRPALLQMLGACGTERFLKEWQVVIDSPITNTGDRPHYLRGSIRDGRFSLNGLQESHALFALSQSHALLRLEAGETVTAGQARGVIVW